MLPSSNSRNKLTPNSGSMLIRASPKKHSKKYAPSTKNANSPPTISKSTPLPYPGTSAINLSNPRNSPTRRNPNPEKSSKKIQITKIRRVRTKMSGNLP